MKYIDLSIEDRKDILRRVQNETGKDPQIVEKDWWVTAILRALYELPYSEHISFKGGTSLSKSHRKFPLPGSDGRGQDRARQGFG